MQGQLDDAEKLHMEVLEVRKRILEIEHPDTLTAMDNLAYICQKQKRFDEAEKLCLKVLEAQKDLGIENPDTLASLMMHTETTD
jgi:hypothetical protein